MQAVLDKTPHRSLPSPSSGSWLTPVRLIALAVIVGTVVGVIWVLTSGLDRPLLKPSFSTGRLITNEYAYRHPADPRASLSATWEVTSGSLFGLHGTGWTGVPDGQNPGPTSAVHTGSAVFRLRTVRSDFQNVSVSFRLKLQQLVTTPRTPAQPYDGVHVWLRYQNADYLYFVSLVRRDGEVVIGKKLPAGSSTAGGGAPAAGGVYFHSVRKGGHFIKPDTWVRMSATIQTIDNRVIIRAFINGQQVARLIEFPKNQPILQPGAVGIRGDNAEFQFRDFQVRAL